MATQGGAQASTGATRICPTCKGAAAIGRPPNAQVCPTCQGQGVIEQQPIRVPFDLVMPNGVLTANQRSVPTQMRPTSISAPRPFSLNCQAGARFWWPETSRE